jgi:hypothetical protein
VLRACFYSHERVTLGRTASAKRYRPSAQKREYLHESRDAEDRVVYMRPSTQHRPTASIEVGHEALAQGAWEEARAHFEAALEEEEIPEALEGLSWSAWWLDDAGAVFDARERPCPMHYQPPVGPGIVFLIWRRPRTRRLN